jgi:predicted ribonuclease toxin of YeeF-YezG toxin-antitoxin module
MAEKPVTKEYLDKSLEKLGGMIKRSFDDVYKRFDDVYQRLDKLDENDKIIMAKLEGIVYRKEFEELKKRVEVIEDALVIKKKI